jgi:ribosome biogenesis protein ERB1
MGRRRSSIGGKDRKDEVEKKEEVEEKVELQEEEEEFEATPDMSPADSDDDPSDEEEEEEEYDSDAGSDSDVQVSDDYDDEDDDDDDESAEGGEFEEQGSSSDEDDDEDDDEEEEDDDDGGVEILDDIDDIDDSAPRSWPRSVQRNVPGGKKRPTIANASVGKGTSNDPSASSTTNDTSASSTSNATSLPAIVDPDILASHIHADDLSSDDEDDDGKGNRIGRVPLHWYDDLDHVGYDSHGNRVIKGKKHGDLLDSVIEHDDAVNGIGTRDKKYTVYDALNARDVTLTPRQLELIRRVQGGAYAHPEHDANPEYVDYFSGVDPIKSGLNSNRYENKSRFQPSKWEKLQVRRLLHRLECGSINMDYLEGRVRDMNDLVARKDGEGAASDDGRPFALWRGDEEDELALRKGPRHVPAPKVPPPGHAYSYNPPSEYLPTDDELREWNELDVVDRPHGHLVPRKYDNLRSVGAYEHAVRERFERCLDLYLCPRASKRRLNIDPESLVPRLPRASDLRPFPTTRCVRYVAPRTICGATSGDEDGGGGEDVPAAPVRCLGASPDGQFLVSGDERGCVRLWEVQTGRLIRSWDLNDVVAVVGTTSGEKGDADDDDIVGGGGGDGPGRSPITSIEWNPNRSHHCILVSLGRCAVVVSTGTGGLDDCETTEALLSAAASCGGRSGGGNGNMPPESRAARAVSWTAVPRGRVRPGTTTSSHSPSISAYAGPSGPVVVLRTNRDVSSVRWHRKGDYFVTVSPSAGAAAVLIHQLSKATSQQPFGKTRGGEAQLACFHPHKPFLLVATREHVRVYHLVKQVMVKRLMSGCRHISSLDVHGSGDHVLVGSLDRRLVWFDLDLSSAPYKTLKYHERALRSVGFHPRYPLMASASDDGTVHVFHAMVYSDLMRNPLIVPVKVLRAHSVVKSLGALSMVFHPTQPWLFSAGADGNIHLYQDI